jgi:uncharacterized protein
MATAGSRWLTIPALCPAWSASASTSPVAPAIAGSGAYKLALLTRAAAYAVITLILALLGPTMASWQLALRTLVLSVTMVGALTWLVMPRLTRACRAWLSPTA